jgi:dolichol kinase
MVNVILCLLGLALFILISEQLYKRKLLKPEDRRKFVHICSGCFIAFWPWLISWRAIQILGLLIVVGSAINNHFNVFRFSKGIHRRTYGEYYFGLAVTACALLTDVKVFFMIAMLEMAVADGLAAVVGKRMGGKTTYKVFGNNKSLVGTLTFWFASLCVIGTGLIFAHDYITYRNYYWLILLLPPALTLIENLFVWGLDDLAVPIVVILALNLAS